MDCPPGQKKRGRYREVAVSGGSTVTTIVATSDSVACLPLLKRNMEFLILKMATLMGKKIN